MEKFNWEIDGNYLKVVDPNPRPTTPLEEIASNLIEIGKSIGFQALEEKIILIKDTRQIWNYFIYENGRPHWEMEFKTYEEAKKLL